MGSELISQALRDPTLANIQALHVLSAQGSSFDERKQMESNGLVHCLSQILLQSSQQQEVRALCWQYLRDFVVIQDLDDSREYGPGSTSDVLLQHGVLELCASELRASDSSNAHSVRCCENILYLVSWAVQDVRVIPKLVMDLRCHVEIVRLLRQATGQGELEPLLEPCMAALRALSILDGATRHQLREDGALDVAVPFLAELDRHRLGQGNETSLRQGFRAASIVSRLAGNDETGIGPQALQGSPLVVETLVVFLRRAVDDTPTTAAADKSSRRAYFAMGTIPSHITVDLLVIAASDVNKPLLVGAIPVLLHAAHAVGQRGNNNNKMVQHIVKILLLLSFDKLCLAELRAPHSRDGLAALDVALALNDAEYRRCLQNLQSMVNPPLLNRVRSMAPNKPASRRGSTLKTLVSTIMTKRRASTLAAAEAAAAAAEDEAEAVAQAQAQVEAEAQALQSQQRHVFLSYNWRSKALVLAVNRLLKDKGKIKTWVDEFDMGANIADSMASAIESASHVVAFLSSRYKESGNCRRECELADTLGVPIVYVMAEEDFKPSGWLALQMGKSLYLSISTVDQATAKIGQLVGRLSSTTGAVLLPAREEEESSADDGNASSSVVVSLLQQLVIKVNELGSEVKAVRDENKQLRDDLAVLLKQHQV